MLFVEIGILPGNFQSDIFAALFGDVANDPRKPAEKLFDGHHANFQHAFVKFVENARLKSQRIRQLGATGIAGMTSRRVR